jgi:hypothetical protein
MIGKRKHSPQSAQRPQRKTLLLTNMEIRVHWFADQKFFSVSVLRDLCDLCGEVLLGLPEPRCVSIFYV